MYKGGFAQLSFLVSNERVDQHLRPVEPHTIPASVRVDQVVYPFIGTLHRAEAMDFRSRYAR